MSDFEGRVLLIVNTASRCGFTPQYAGLERLYRAYRDCGFAVLAFPCNQFGAQEPGSADEIGAFCKLTYDVTFPIFAKIDVNGPQAHPLFVYLCKQKPGLLGLFGKGAVHWNFTKFLVNRQGRVLSRFGPARKPEALAQSIEKALEGGNRDA